ncbi:MAG: hypothetical protein JW863_22425 [Chitinispirillaceae bacterium]|nr:hypothetical protein [Chitinispirillaceae bacterium]
MTDTARQHYPHCRRELFPAALLFYLITTSLTHAAVPPGMDCMKWRDSMITAGVRNLDGGNLDAARSYLTAAYECGMSKDSMHYFAAELFLRSGALDTALTFNRALEQGGHFSRKAWLEQRSRIFRRAGWIRPADSLVALYSNHGRHDISATFTGIRNGMAINGITFMPQRYLFTFPDVDIDDYGKCGVDWKWTRYTFFRLPKISIGVNARTELPLPTRHSFDESNDTLMRNFTLSVSLGELPVTPVYTVSYRLRLHKDLRTDHFAIHRFSFSFARNGMAALLQETKWIPDQGIDDSRTEIALFRLPFGRNIRTTIGGSAAHHFSRSDLYQNRLNRNSIFRPLPLGFVDTLTPGERYRYFTDRQLTTRYELPEDQLPDMSAYWSAQPGMMMLSPLPEHDLNGSAKVSFQFRLPRNMKIGLFTSFTGMWFPRKIEWYSVAQPVSVLPSYVYDAYSIVFNNADGKYYLNKNRTSLNYEPGELIEVHRHTATRIDGYLAGTLLFEKKFKTVGNIFILGTYLKGFSTIDRDGPVAILNSLWEISAGWKKEIMLVKR